MAVVLTDAERAIYTTRLTEAQTAKHSIVTGKMLEQFIDQNGEQVRYTKTNLADLDAYIDELNGLLNPALAAYYRPRPIGFIF